MSLSMVGVFGVVGLVGALAVIGLTKMAESLGFRPLVQWQVIANGQRGRADEQATSDLERATRSILPPVGEGKTGGVTIQSKAIERPKAGLEELDLFSPEKQELKSKLARLNHLEEKTRTLSSAEEAETDMEVKITIQTKEIKRLQGKLEKKDQLLQEKTAKLSNLEQAIEKQDAEKEEKIARLESEVARLNRILQEYTTPLPSAEEAATDREQLSHDLLATNQQREEINQMKTAPCTGTDSERTNMLVPQTVVNKADSICVAEVAELVRILNAHIEQGSSLIADSLLNQESQSTGKELDIIWDEVDDIIGSWLCKDLKRRSKGLIVEPDPLITQITLQTGLVNACSRIINDWNTPLWVDGSIRSRAYGTIEKTNGQTTANAWGALLRSHTSNEHQEANKRYLTEVLLKLITAVGGSLENGILPPQYDEVVDDILKKSLKLHKVISEDLIPMTDLLTDTIPCDAEFDPSRMVDTEGNQRKTGSGRVVCTVEIGLRCRKRFDIEENGSSEEWDVTMKSKVVLATTLELELED